MRTKQRNKPAKQPEIDEIDINAVIEELKNDLEAERQLENDKIWLRYCYSPLRKRAEQICRELNLPPEEIDAVLSGHRSSHDKEWQQGQHRPDHRNRRNLKNKSGKNEMIKFGKQVPHLPRGNALHQTPDAVTAKQPATKRPKGQT